MNQIMDVRSLVLGKTYWVNVDKFNITYIGPARMGYIGGSGHVDVVFPFRVWEPITSEAGPDLVPLHFHDFEVYEIE